MKARRLLCIATLLMLLLSSCKGNVGEEAEDITVSLSELEFGEDDKNTEISKDAEKAETDENGKTLISKGGEYIFEGEVKGGITVDAKGETVRLIFNGVTVKSENTAPVNIKKAEKVIITLARGTENFVYSTGDYAYDDKEKEEPSAAIFSKCDLTLNGEGALRIETDFNDGITSKDVLRISGGSISVKSADDGIIGRDAILIDSGSFIIEAGGDGIKATNDEDTSLGYVHITDGIFNIEASADGIQGETAVNIDAGTFEIKTGGGSANASYSEDGWNDGWGAWRGGGFEYTEAEEDTSSESAKAIKAGVSLTVSGGNLNIDSSDDSIHSNGNVSVSGGNIIASSGDDGIHADNALYISGGNITLTKSYEGLEASDISVSGGNISVIAADDGINGAGGNDSSSMGGRPGQNQFASGTATFNMSAGELYVSASGDGIDINGSAVVDGGKITVYGPTNSGNGILDFDTSFEINGGTFIALGSSGMLQGFTGGKQASVAGSFGNVTEGDTLSLEDSAGNVIFTVDAEKSASALIFSSPELTVGKTYTFFYTRDGEKTELGYYTQSETTMGSSGAGQPGGPGAPGGGRPGGRPDGRW